MLYCEEGKAQLREAMRQAGLRELNFRFEFEGSKVVFDIVSRDGRLAHMRGKARTATMSPKQQCQIVSDCGSGSKWQAVLGDVRGELVIARERRNGGVQEQLIAPDSTLCR